jgi:zinc ribbon protein
MGFLDNLSKTISQGVDRAKFEADKLQKNLRLQNEIAELKKQIDAKRMEFGDRALELYKAGQFQSATLGEILQAMEALRASVTLKEEELKMAQADAFVEPTPPAGVQGQTVPGSAMPPAQPGPQAPSVQGTTTAEFKNCPNCQFQMPAAAMFCPNCGARLGV